VNQNAKRQTQKDVGRLGAVHTPIVVGIVRAVVRQGGISAAGWNRNSHWLQLRGEEVRQFYILQDERKYLRRKPPRAVGDCQSTGGVAEIGQLENSAASARGSARATINNLEISPRKLGPMRDRSGIFIRLKPKSWLGGLLLEDKEKFLGTRIYGPVCKEIRGGDKEVKFKRIISYAQSIL